MWMDTGQRPERDGEEPHAGASLQKIANHRSISNLSSIHVWYVIMYRSVVIASSSLQTCIHSVGRPVIFLGYRCVISRGATLKIEVTSHGGGVLPMVTYLNLGTYQARM